MTNLRIAFIPAIVSLAAGAMALGLAAHYPLSSTAAVALAVATMAVAANMPLLCVMLPALVPLLGFAPWTGWITFEEQDILLLAAVAGAYARAAWRRPAPGNTRLARDSRTSTVWLWGLLMALFAMATVVSMFRGFADAGGFSFAWFHGYHESMNSVRLAKSYLAALLVLPLWQAACCANPQRASQLLSAGVMVGLTGASLATIWERLAFTGLLNFSTDYRTTALFWEMHVGGAALDGFLALTVPFALRELLQARTFIRWNVAAGVMALAAYACLTTFSRGVYLAVPVGVVVFMALRARQTRPTDSAGTSSAVNAARPDHSLPWGASLMWVSAFGAGAAWMFPTSGYRGMAALLATVMLALALARVLRGGGRRQWLNGLAVGTGLSMLTWAVAWLVPKGAYIGFAVVWVLTLTALLWSRLSRPAPPWLGASALAGFMACVTGAVLVAQHWGDAVGGWRAAPVLLVALGIALIAGWSRKPLWPDSLRWQGTTVGMMGLVAFVVGVFGGGSYMTERFSTGGHDFGGRLVHWKLGQDMLRGPGDWLLGKGMGRFPANYFLMGNPSAHPGDYRMKRENDNIYLTLTGGLHVMSAGEFFRVVQRVAQPGGAVVVTAHVRAEKDVSLHFEVCEKHLLYSNGCLSRLVPVKGVPGAWQPLRLELQGGPISRGDWYAPKLLAFSMAMASGGGSVDLDDIAMTDSSGHQLLSNGDFMADGAKWFFSSDRHHLPWHIKSIFMHVLFEQGALGVTLWGLLLAGGIWRVSMGSARRHPMAPVLAASLIGFTVVGLFDSLLDVPRLAWLFYLLLLLALTLPSESRGSGLDSRSRPAT
jgi:hypothetical protein